MVLSRQILQIIVENFVTKHLSYFCKNFVTFLLHPVAVNPFVNTVHICVNAVVMKSFVTVAFILTRA